MDISVPLDLSTVSRDDSGVVTKSKDNMDEFYKCLGGLKALVKKSTPKTSS
jgi:hypothetical protein